jgi:hypothetical protein
MNGLFVVIIFFLFTFLLEKITNVKPTIDFHKKIEYVPILTANIIADLIIIYVTFSKIIYNSPSLIGWYKKYRLSAMIADILIGVIYMLLARFIAFSYKLNLGLTTFASLCVFIQILFDFLFYLLFSIIPKGQNDMLDFFKMYAKEVGINAIYSDSVLVIIAVVISAFLNRLSFDSNIIFLILSIYLAPYFVYLKD